MLPLCRLIPKCICIPHGDIDSRWLGGLSASRIQVQTVVKCAVLLTAPVKTMQEVNRMSVVVNRPHCQAFGAAYWLRNNKYFVFYLKSGRFQSLKPRDGCRLTQPSWHRVVKVDLWPVSLLSHSPPALSAAEEKSGAACGARHHATWVLASHISRTVTSRSIIMRLIDCQLLHGNSETCVPQIHIQCAFISHNCLQLWGSICQ